MFRLATVLFSSFLSFLLATAAAQAQITTSKVTAQMSGVGCDNVTTVYLVVDDEDHKSLWIPMEDTGKCHWTASLGEDGSVSTALSHFSLRVGSARTDCRQAAAKDLVAELEFEYSDAPGREVRIKTEPPIPVSYVRRVPKNSNRRIRGVACVEGGTFPAGSGSILNSQFSGEKVYLQLGSATPQRRAPGVLLNDINEIAADDGALVLTRNGVAYRLLVQRAKGKGQSAPTLSSNAISLDIKRLTELKLESARIEVIK